MQYFAPNPSTGLKRLTRLQLAWPIVFIITLALCVLTVQHFISGLAEAENAESYALRLDRELAAVLQASTDIETGARGFALTRAKAFLEPHEAGVANIQSHLDQLRVLAQKDEQQKILYAELTSFVIQRIEAANELIEPKSGLRDDIAARGKSAQDGLRSVVEKMSQNANAASTRHQEQAKNFRTVLRVALVLSPVLLMILVLLWRRAIVRYGRAREGLRMAEARSAQIIEHTPNGIVTVDRGGKIVSANPGFCRILGFEKGELEGTPYRSLIDQQGSTDAAAAIRALEQDGKVFHGELCLIGKEGNPVWMRVAVVWLQGEADEERCSLIVAEDITERRAAQGLLQRSEARFRAIAKLSNDAIWEWDRCKASMWRRAGYWESNLLPGPGIDSDANQWLELLHPDDRDAVARSFASALAGADHEWAAEYRYLRHDGSYRNIADRAMLLRDANGNVTHAVGGMRDLTDACRMQNAMMQMAASVVGDQSSDFFHTLSSNLISGLGANAGGIVRLDADGLSAHTLAFVKDGQTYDSFNFRLAGTPFQEVIEKHACFIESDLQPRYDDSANHFDATAFLGETLLGADEKPLGFIFVMYSGQLEKSQFLASALRVFATRASAEIARLEADILLREQAALLDHAQEAIVVLNLDLKVRYWNSGAEQMYGWSRAEAKKLGISSTYEDEHSAAACMKRVLEHGEWHGELPQRHRDGRALISEERWTLICAKDGAPYSVLRISSDITARKAAEEQIRKLAYFDSLTGLPNRSLFMDRVGHARSCAARSKRPGALLIIDMDNFKNLNDLHGHNAGDAFLRATAQRMSLCVRAGDTVARLGGDEFVVILENLKGDPDDAVHQAMAVAKKLLTALAKPFDLDGVRHHCTASIGITLFNDELEPLDDLLGQADIAMYSAKANGRNTCRVYTRALQQFLTRSLIPEELHTAIDENQLELWYQPQYEADGTLYGAEALLRWRHPRRGLLLPGEFIPIAEQGGLIVLLGNWVLTAACRQLAIWSHHPEMASLDLSVNISPRQLYQDGFVEDVLATLANAGAPARRLTLEITESVLDDSNSNVEEKIARLRRCGIRFSLDDFGTGYSSLSRLRRLPLDELKIDRSFISDMENNSTSRAIVAMILTLGRTMKLHVVAEGIETAAQRDMLAADGCNAFQGYLLGRPLTKLDFEALQWTTGAIALTLEPAST